VAFDAFMYFDGNGADQLKGESTDKVFSAKKAFEIHSFSLGVHNSTSVGSEEPGMAAGRASISCFNITKFLDAASPGLFLACCNGTHVGAAHVVVRKAGGKEALQYLTYDFTTVMVQSIQWTGSAGDDDRPTESVSFAFAKVDGKYAPQTMAGAKGTPIPFTWDVTENTSE
jgi:type VI secretion system secreted protein Hcp